MQLVFASANKNKISEIKALMPKQHTVIGLQDVGIFNDIPETGITLQQNSFIKANYVLEFLKNRNKTGVVFADDSGLEVEALNGAPGVYSARYAGEPKNDENNNVKLLSELKNSKNRNARFITVITLILNNENYYFEGEIKGTIALQHNGSMGFGYDPLFIPYGYSETFAQMSIGLKNTISHRAIAVTKLINFMNTL
jgi:XTP/dITP diphosphohydrolase